MQSDLGWMVHLALQICLDDAKNVPLMWTPWFQFQRHRIDPFRHAGESSRLGRRGNEKSCVGFVPSTYPPFSEPGFGLFRQMFRQGSDRSNVRFSIQIKHWLTHRFNLYGLSISGGVHAIRWPVLLYQLAYMESHITSRVRVYGITNNLTGFGMG